MQWPSFVRFHCSGLQSDELTVHPLGNQPGRPPSAAATNAALFRPPTSGMFSFQAAPAAAAAATMPFRPPMNPATTMSGAGALPTMMPTTTPVPTAPPMIDADGVPRVLAKRKLQDLVGQIDPQERLDPEVEDVTSSPNPSSFSPWLIMHF